MGLISNHDFSAEFTLIFQVCYNIVSTTKTERDILYKSPSYKFKVIETPGNILETLITLA